jgi:hypothetical protein
MQMEDTINSSSETAIIPEAQNETGTDIMPSVDTAAEARLTTETSELWATHSRLGENHKATAIQIRQIRARLAECLFAIKAILSRPDAGRGGRWKSWLRERAIPRSTADRIVARHAETLCGDDGIVPNGALSEPEQVYAEKLAKLVWSRARNVLTSDQSVIQFLTHILTAANVAFEERDEAVVIFNVVPEAADGFRDSASAPDPASATSDGGDVNPDEFAAEDSAIQQVAGDGDNYGEVLA